MALIHGGVCLASLPSPNIFLCTLDTSSCCEYGITIVQVSGVTAARLPSYTQRSGLRGGPWVRFDVDGPGTRTSGRATTTIGGGFINCQTKRQQVRGDRAYCSQLHGAIQLRIGRRDSTLSTLLGLAAALTDASCGSRARDLP